LEKRSAQEFRIKELKKETLKTMQAENPQNKSFDICVFGASGFTGNLVAQYLAQHEDTKKISWAVAGRNKQKLERLVETLDCENKPSILIADVGNMESLLRMCEASRVVITTVGPYTRYGEPLVKACVESKSDYVDLVGEPNFVDLMRYRYHEEAIQAGVKIVNACGFDSIPHDLGVLFTLGELRKNIPEEKQKYSQIECEGFVASNARFSGGTWHSAITAMSSLLSHRKLKKSWKEEGYTGNENMQPGRYVKAGIPQIFFHKKFSKWALPLPTIDPEIVTRSAQLRDDYGMRFSYKHYALIEYFWQPPLLMLGVAVAFVMAQFRWGREQLEKVISPGEGPSEERRNNSWFTVDFFARAGKQEIHTRVSGGDPGYSETSKMLAESALCLALQREECPDFVGVSTSAAAMGEVLIARLKASGIGFEVV
jgi:short subunit dehydrogenase-like uncharacterized protein